MRLRSLEVLNFRNHSHTAIECGEKVNSLIGENGQGKTNLLEAISYLCLTKSFFANSDSVSVQIGKNGFALNAEFLGDSKMRYEVGLTYDAAERVKRFSVNKSVVERFADVVGHFPVVVLSQESGAITTGGPAERRRFMDFVIAQSSKLYLEELLAFRTVLKQRNKMLLDAKLARTDCAGLLEPWDVELIEQGTRIVLKRKAFVEEMRPLVHKSYSELAGTSEVPSLEYKPEVSWQGPGDAAEIREQFRRKLTEKRREELQTAATLVGPHRDEVEMKINGLDLRRYASQGQHKTFLIALKIAEFLYLVEQRSERPVLLLDDIFGDLDGARSKRLLELIYGLGQAFITTTSEAALGIGTTWGSENRKFLVQNGSVVT